MAASLVLPGGAPMANQNARVHGLYARYVPLADLQEALNIPLDDLQLEIALVRRSLAELVGAATETLVTAPFFCDYGSNIRLGNRVYFNFNCVILDVAPVSIGDNVLFGPGVHIYTALHP